MIIARKLSKVYPHKRALDEISVEFEEGKISALIGGNGAGKSTLLRILSGSVRPSSGEVIVGKDQKRIHAVRGARSEGIWMADQEGSLIPAWTIQEHFSLLAGVRSGQPWRSLVPGADGSERVADLPQLERQLIELSLVCSGGVVAALFDEPTAGLPIQQKNMVVDALRRCAASGSAVVWVTHDLDSALTTADRIIALQSGKVVHDSKPAETTKQALLATFSVADRPAQPALTPPASHASGVRKRICLDRLNNLAIEFHDAEIVGLVSNQTSHVRSVLRSAAGLDGARGARGEMIQHSCVAYMSRERDLEWDFTGRSLQFNLTAGALRIIAPFGIVDDRRERGLAQEFVERFCVEAESLDTPIETLSGGNRQKALLARLTSMNRGTLLLDEPFSGVDAPTRVILRSELRRMAEEGTAIVVFSQEWDDLIQAVDRILVIPSNFRPISVAARSASARLLEDILAGVNSEKMREENCSL